MIRFTQGSEEVKWVDEEKHPQGRGAYLCPDLGCLNMAMKKNRKLGTFEGMDFQSPFMKEFFQRIKRVEIEEEGNGKE